MKETLAEQNARYIREGRTVSGGDASPPGKPGSVAVSLFIDQGDHQLLSVIIALLQNEGFTVDSQTASSVLVKRGYSE